MSERIPFNVEEWRSGNYDVEIRTGQKVTSLHVHDENIPMPISFIHEGSDEIDTCTLSGSFSVVYEPTEYDLFLVPKNDAVTVSREDIKVALEWYNRLHHDMEITQEDIDVYAILKDKVNEPSSNA